MAFDQQVTFLYTRDLAASARFYEDVLGLELALDQGACRIYRAAPGSFIGLCQRDDAAENSRDVIVTFVSQDVDGWYAALREKGVAFEKPPTFNPQYNIYHCFLRDPNGYLLEIQRFLSPEWG